MHKTPEFELASRIARFQVAMQTQDLDAVVAVQSADLFDFTGSIQSGTLYVPVTGDPIYLVRKDVERARAESALAHVVPIGSLRGLPSILWRDPVGLDQPWSCGSRRQRHSC